MIVIRGRFKIGRRHPIHSIAFLKSGKGWKTVTLPNNFIVVCDNDGQLIKIREATMKEKKKCSHLYSIPKRRD